MRPRIYSRARFIRSSWFNGEAGVRRASCARLSSFLFAAVGGGRRRLRRRDPPHRPPRRAAVAPSRGPQAADGAVRASARLAPTSRPAPTRPPCPGTCSSPTARTTGSSWSTRAAGSSGVSRGPGGRSLPLPDDAFFSPNGRQIVVTEEDVDAVSVVDVASRRIVWRYGAVGVPGSSREPARAPRRRDDAARTARSSLPTSRTAASSCSVRPCIGPIRATGSPAEGCVHDAAARVGQPERRVPARGRRDARDGDQRRLGRRALASGRLLWSTHPPGVSYPSDSNEVRPGLYVTVGYQSPGDPRDVRPARDGSAGGTGRARGTGARPSLARAAAPERRLPRQRRLQRPRDRRRPAHEPRRLAVRPHRAWRAARPGYLSRPDGVDLVPPAALLSRIHANDSVARMSSAAASLTDLRRICASPRAAARRRADRRNRGARRSPSARLPAMRPSISTGRSSSATARSIWDNFWYAGTYPLALVQPPLLPPGRARREPAARLRGRRRLDGALLLDRAAGMGQGGALAVAHLRRARGRAAVHRPLRVHARLRGDARDAQAAAAAAVPARCVSSPPSRSASARSPSSSSASSSRHTPSRAGRSRAGTSGSASASALAGRDRGGRARRLPGGYRRLSVSLDRLRRGARRHDARRPRRAPRPRRPRRWSRSTRSGASAASSSTSCHRPSGTTGLA